MATSHNFLPPNLAKFGKIFPKGLSQYLFFFFVFPLPNGENVPKKEPWQEVKKKG
jgi:hypothetical protein